MAVALNILVNEAGYSIATWDRVFLQIWRSEVTEQAVHNLTTLGKAFVKNSREPGCTLSIVEASSPPPSERLRGTLSAFYREVAPHVNEQIVVAEGGGFRGALVRSVGLALSAVAPKRMPFRFVGSVEEAALLIRPHLSSICGGAVGLQKAISELRAAAHGP